jgi:electron transfer flavoprotein alpha/beta subunit
MKVVPDTDLHLELDPLSKRLDSLSLFYEINPHDLVALREALNLRTQADSRISAYHAGTESSQTLLRRVLLAGVDEVHLIVHLSQSLFSRSDALVSLSERFKSDEPDVIFCGAESTDDMQGALAAQLAQKLDYPLVSQVMRAVCVQGEPKTLELKRLAAPGWTQRVRCRIPLVLSTAPYSPTDAASVDMALLPERIDRKVQIHHWQPSAQTIAASDTIDQISRSVRLFRARNRRRPTPAPDQSLPATDRIAAIYFSEDFRENGVTITGAPEELADQLLHLLDQMGQPLAAKRD